MSLSGDALRSGGRQGRSTENGLRSGGVTFGEQFAEAVHAEWTKLRTMAGTYWLLSTMVVLTVGVSGAVVATSDYQPNNLLDPTKLALSGIQVGQVVAVVIGAVTVGNEYGTGMMRSSLTAVPRRVTFLAAKAITLVTVTLATGAVAVSGCLALGRLVLPGNGFTAAHGYTLISVVHEATLRAAVGSVFYLALVALLSLGIAAAVRDSATAIGLVLALIYLFPLLAQVVSDPTWRRHLEQWGPMPAGLAVQATTNLHGLPIGPWAGLGVLAAWAATATLAGTARLCSQDA